MSTQKPASFLATIPATAAPEMRNFGQCTVHWGASPFPDVIQLQCDAPEIIRSAQDSYMSRIIVGLSLEQARDLAIALRTALRIARANKRAP